jgi:2',3'-cyclic-nucleotide 2'-phosphodiesterase (5'-nucleotidase family)
VPFAVALVFLCWNINAHADKVPITILHTNDLHSAFEGSGPDTHWKNPLQSGEVRGHYARLACTIKAERAARAKSNEPLMLFDGGDFFGGTMFQAIGPGLTEPMSPELEFFARMRYDAITLGNHDFDAGRLGLQRMLDKARARGATTPVVASNLEPLDPSKRTGKNSMTLPAHALLEIKTKSKPLRVGVLGLLAPAGIMLSAPARGGLKFAGFRDKASKQEKSIFFKAARISLQALRKEYNPDLVVALVHGGDIDEELAQKVEGMDVIISGHTHQSYLRREGRTIIAQAGRGGESLGRIRMLYDTEAKSVEFATPNAENEHLIPMDGKACMDQNELASIRELKKAASRAVASAYDRAVFTAKTSYPFKHESQLPLGRFVWSNVRSALNKHLGKPVDVYLGTLGVLRGEIKVTNETTGTPLQFSDIFRILSLGFETIPAGSKRDESNIIPGSPVVLFYLRKGELKTLLEFLEFFGKFAKVAIPATSDNVNYTTRWWGIPLVNRLGGFTVDGKSLDELPDLMSIATTSYIASFFKQLRSMSYGLVRVSPRDAYDVPLKEFKPINVPREYQLLAEALEGSAAKVPAKGD